MGLCSALLPFLTNPLTYLGLGGLGLAVGAVYYYSSFTFLSGLMVFSRLSSGFNFVWNRLKEAWKYGLVKLLAVYTTFQGSIHSAWEDGVGIDTVVLAGEEFLGKATLSIKNIIEGLQLFTDWVSGYSNGVCSLAQSNELVLSAVVSVWTGVAAYIFVIWLWDKLWYDWRSREMEQQQIYLIIIVVSSLSLAVYGFDILANGVSSTESLVNTLGNLTGNTNKTS